MIQPMVPYVEPQSDYLDTVQQLRQTHEELNHFVRALGHDMNANFMLLDNSFSRLKNALDGQNEGDLGETVAHVDACLRESRRFLEDLLDLAKTGTVGMEPNRVDLKTVVDEVLFEQHDLLAKRDVETNMRPTTPTVWCNRKRLKQIVTNLIRNAALHGCDSKEPKVTISCTPVPDTTLKSRPTVSIRIHDNGPGIDPAFAEEAFVPGRRLARGKSDGSGMGLAIVRKIVEHYGGTARIDSECKQGTAVEVTLPVADQHGSLERPHWERTSADEPCHTVSHDAPHSPMTPTVHPPRNRHGLHE